MIYVQQTALYNKTYIRVEIDTFFKRLLLNTLTDKNRFLNNFSCAVFLIISSFYNYRIFIHLYDVCRNKHDI